MTSRNVTVGSQAAPAFDLFRLTKAKATVDAMQGQTHFAADAVHNGLIDAVVSGQAEAVRKMPTVKKPSQPPTREDYDGGVENPNGKPANGQAESEWAATRQRAGE
jgi:hypothetical protein